MLECLYPGHYNRKNKSAGAGQANFDIGPKFLILINFCIQPCNIIISTIGQNWNGIRFTAKLYDTDIKQISLNSNNLTEFNVYEKKFTPVIDNKRYTSIYRSVLIDVRNLIKIKKLAENSKISKSRTLILHDDFIGIIGVGDGAEYVSAFVPKAADLSEYNVCPKELANKYCEEEEGIDKIF